MKKLAYFAAVSVVFLAQATSVQVPVKAPPSFKVVNQAMTLQFITPRTATAAVSVYAGGALWSFLFNNSGNIASVGATVAGVVVAPDKLKVGMSCVLNGTKSTGTNTITTLACK